MEVSPKGPLSEKNKQLIRVEIANEFGPNNLNPSKSLNSGNSLSFPSSLVLQIIA